MITMVSEVGSRLTSRAELSLSERDEMFQLLAEHFTGVTRHQFDLDLDEKNWIILLEREGRLSGFSTLTVYETSFADQPVSVVYSGDTIVAREAWGSTALARTWIASVNQLRVQYSRGPYYWLLLTSGFRTYRFLPVFWHEFYPRYDAPAPSAAKSLMDKLASERFGHQYDPHAGIVRFDHPQRLRSELAEVPPGRATNPHVAFFEWRNPGHKFGDELVCLTELTDSNLTTAGRRMVSGAA
jgi:hypothetical protein